jgi:hypothetical protein
MRAKTCGQRASTPSPARTRLGNTDAANASADNVSIRRLCIAIFRISSSYGDAASQ